MEAASTSETSVNFYHTTRSNNPEDSYLHTRRRENLKSHSVRTDDAVVEIQIKTFLMQISFFSVASVSLVSKLELLFAST
jgi:hypothetical protein